MNFKLYVMKKLTIAFALFMTFCFASCCNCAKTDVVVENDTTAVDTTLVDTTIVDTVVADSL